MSACERAHDQPRGHQRHRPERTVLHGIVRAHLGDFVALAEERYARPLPKYVRRAFERYLRCGLPEHGFLRLRCDDCGHDRIVALSCKERGTCPSCAGRVMANTAAHVVDRVLPNVPIRQWVLSLPFELRTLAAKRPEVVCAIDRILFREVERWMQRRVGPKRGRAGALTFVQRFGGSLNLHVHLHVLFLEGLFTRAEDSAPVFHPALSPTRADLLEVLARVQCSVGRWLKKQRLEPDTDANESDTALDGCARVAVQRGLFDALPGGAKPLVDDDEPAGLGRHSVSLDGFNLHAAVAVSADDDVSRERLVRYCARPPFALERLSFLPDGRIAYRIKQPRKNATHRILEPVELLARIAALVPPPRHPFLRYHGILAPASKWRSAIVPRPEAHEEHAHAHAPNRAPEPTPDAKPRDTTSRTATTSHRGSRPPCATITDAHRRRLANGALLAESPRLEWSKLLRRTFATEVLLCPRCHGQSRIIAAVQDPSEARRFLAALHELSHPLPTPARSAVDDEDDDCQSPPSSRPDPIPPDD